MGSKRVAVAGLFHETHTFVEGTTPLDAFSQLRGPALLDTEGDASPLGGFLESAASFGWEVAPLIDYRATPSAIVEDDVFSEYWRELEESLVAEASRGLDALFLVLHGAMVTASLHDVEGELLERIRRIPSVARLPIFGVFDLHANFSERMARGANALVAYRENPHTDAKASAERAAALLDRSFSIGRVPRTYWRQVPLMWPPTGTGTSDLPMRSLETLARKQEEADPGLWTVNVVAGFAFADTPDTGVSFTVVTDADESRARQALEELGGMALESRELGNVTEADADEVMRTILPVDHGPIVVVEPSDNIGGGAPGDGTGLLRILLRNAVDRAAVVINDPGSVTALQDLRIGGTMTLDLGGKGSRLDEGPVSLDVTLVSKSNGEFTLEDRQSHLASMQGERICMGPCAVVRHGGITILLTSRKTPPFDLGQLRSQGIEPTELSIIGVKAAVAHRRAYDPIAHATYYVATPGPCTSRLDELPYKHIRRPIFPLDQLEGPTTAPTGKVPRRRPS